MSTVVLPNSKSKPTGGVQKMVTLAMLSAIAYGLVTVFRIPIWGFLDYEPKGIIIVMAGFIYGPFSAFMISLVVSLLEMFTISETGFVGMIMNLLANSAFACTAAFVYIKMHSKQGALIGLALGTVAMTTVMVLWNYLITPMYMEIPREAIKGMLLPIFVPFNLLKCGLNTAVTLLLYKPIISGLRRSGLLPQPEVSEGRSALSSPGFLILGGFMLISLTLIILAFKGML